MPSVDDILAFDGFELRFGDDAPFQVMPPLSSEDYENLKADISKHGVLVAIEVDEEGVIIDGHHRARVCWELGLVPPVRVRTDLGEVDKRAIARSLNVARRHLDTATKRAIIADQLRDAPQMSNRAIARDLGVSDGTVRAVRSDLGLEQDRVVGEDGKTYAGGKKPYERGVSRHIATSEFEDGDQLRAWRHRVRELRVEGETIAATLLRKISS